MEGGAGMSDPLFGMADGVETIAIPARKATGEVVDSDPQIYAALHDCKKNGKVPIVHSVYGSKTGICQDV